MINFISQQVDNLHFTRNLCFDFVGYLILGFIMDETESRNIDIIIGFSGWS